MILSVPRTIVECFELLDGGGYHAYLVGGCVRDCFLDLTPSDWDICTNALPQQIITCFAHYKTFSTGARHGTVTVLVEKTAVEITTFRSDGTYTDHRRPDQVVFSDSLKADLSRRDFTINAMAWHPETGLIDYFGGKEDINDRTVRCVGEPDKRFSEDALRILRMFRFSAQLGFQINPDTLQAAGACREYLRFVSAERIQIELGKILLSDNAGATFEKMGATGVLNEILPEVAQNGSRASKQHPFSTIDQAPKDLPVRLALLLHDIGKTDRCFSNTSCQVSRHEDADAQMARNILTRLRYDRKTTDCTVKLISYQNQEVVPDAFILKQLLSCFGEDFLRRLLDFLIAATSVEDSEAAGERLLQLQAAAELLNGLLKESPPCRLADLAVSGQDLLQLGYLPGPEVGWALQHLLELVLEDGSRNTVSFLRKEAVRLRERLRG